ncbi:MAG: hypothetical protein BRD48_06210 [Bacteroidetes bacterium QS_9_68_14]|nr:MAG: hypothetical protein BRD48_06210 [Bacteroidetes bacterium QS_9_68_14]
MIDDAKELVSDFLPDRSEEGEAYALGLVVAERRLHALLLERSPEGPEVVRRFTRRRGGSYAAGGGFAGEEDYGAAGGVPPLEGEETSGDDFAIQFGDDASGGNDNLFLGSEFDGLEDADDDFDTASFGAGGGGANSGAAANFSLELGDLLEECANAGYPDPALAFCLPASDMTQVELVLDEVEATPEAPPAPEDVGRKTLRKALDEQYGGHPEKGRFAFLPMTPTPEEQARFLALVGKPTDPVVSTLRAMKDQNERLPGQGLLETEPSLYLGLARAALAHAEAEQDDALVVRVGEENTLALFTRGTAVHQVETLRSLTDEDTPETVCSRVLLLQDEYGIDDMEHVLVAGPGAEEAALVESFEMFFPEAHVEPMRQHLPAGATAEDDPAAGLTAVAAALRLTGHDGYASFFEDVDLLPPKLLIWRFELPFSSAVPLLLALLAVAGTFFGVRYQHMENQQAEVQRRLDAYPDDFAEKTPQQLQADIDSVKSDSERYVEGLETLDDLLMGSDQWSHALAEISRETAAVSGIWVENWTPQSQTVRLQGNATSRDRVVELAERTEGRIQSVTFSEIRDWPVYSFAMEVPLKTGLPEATKYLREQALASADSAAAGAPAGASGQSAGGPPSNAQ